MGATIASKYPLRLRPQIWTIPVDPEIQRLRREIAEEVLADFADQLWLRRVAPLREWLEGNR